ncbi:MAG: hypothetical protein ACK5BV_07010 [Bacteroidota bacterium]|jgi:hypothetical protein
MKRLTIIFIIIFYCAATKAQLFDGTIFGALPGRQKDLIEYYEKKGFRAVNALGNSNETVVMEGVINGTGTSYNNMDYLIRIQKDSTDPDYVKSISLFYPKNADSVISQMKHYQKAFINSFGLPSQELTDFYRWIFLHYIYTIGHEDQRVYHRLEINEKSTDKSSLREFLKN